MFSSWYQLAGRQMFTHIFKVILSIIGIGHVWCSDSAGPAANNTTMDLGREENKGTPTWGKRKHVGPIPYVGSLSLLQGIFPTQGSNPGLPHCRRILYQLSHQGSPKNPGVGSLSLLQEVFQTQELNRGLPHCRRILYQLSYQGSLNIL